MQVFGPNKPLTAEGHTTQQTLIIPYHPSHTGGVPVPVPYNDSAADQVECSVYANLDSSNPNWLPGLPRPPPGVFVEPPRNRSKRERLRYLSQLNRFCVKKGKLWVSTPFIFSYNSAPPPVPSFTWKLNSFLLIVLMVICIGSFIK